MTVEEVIRQLKKYPQTARVVVVNGMHTREVQLVQEAPEWVLEEVSPDLAGAVEIHSGVRVG